MHLSKFQCFRKVELDDNRLSFPIYTGCLIIGIPIISYTGLLYSPHNWVVYSYIYTYIYIP